MCGIVGIFAYHYAANPVDRVELQRIRDHMAARGPDGYGEWHSDTGRVGFGHRRLAIVDLSERGKQPMVSADGDVVITFNGEIYNYRELRADLQSKGRTFLTDSDTEVLLHLYLEKGEAMVRDLRGMFALGLWDKRRSALLLARDPYGIKPLYYSDDGWTFRFASQVKALMQGGKISRDPEPAGLVGFCLFGSVPEPFTTFQGIRALPAGSTLWVTSIGAGETTPYFSVAQEYCDAEVAPVGADDEEAQLRVRSAVLDSVRHHLVADVPVGAFLSAGVDSGALVGLMRDAGQREIQTVTLGFEEFRGTKDDESAIAEEIAKQYGTRHTTRFVTEPEFQQDIPQILEAMDQPSIDGVNTWFVAKVAHEQGLKVAISGLGGDELFGSYPSFRDLPRSVSLFAAARRIPWLGKATRWLLSSVNEFSHIINPKGAGIIEYGGSYAGAYLLRRGVFMPWEIERIVGKEIAWIGLRRLKVSKYIGDMLRPVPRTAFGKVATLESSLYMRNQLLRDTDWASMAHSLEVRVPLVDARLLSNLAPLTTKSIPRTKHMLANSPQLPLPQALIERPKTGFGTPIQKWLQGDKRLQRWRQNPSLVVEGCPWARRWAFQVAGG
jgi:asparagine synthase (glutamine-hydrolysing)